LRVDINDSMTEERKRAKATLLEDQAYLEFVLGAADLGTWELDLTTDISSVRSLRHDQMFGFVERQAEWGREIAERHILAEDLPVYRSALARARETGQFGCEVRVRWPDGSIHWIAPQGQVRLDAEGRPSSLRGVVADITLYRQGVDQILAQKLPVSQANTALQTQITQRTDERATRSIDR
jgi:two-component system, cell cycle sensor histidine kinase and response regulator CckA